MGKSMGWSGLRVDSEWIQSGGGEMEVMRSGCRVDVSRRGVYASRHGIDSE